MTDLRMVTTSDQIEPDTSLTEYWRRKYDALQDESTPATIRSLRAQLQSIRQVLTEETDAAEVQRRILVHVELGLAISRKETR